MIQVMDGNFSRNHNGQIDGDRLNGVVRAHRRDLRQRHKNHEWIGCWA